MSAWIRSVTGRASQSFVPIAQSTERARPKRQVAGENPAGDTIFCGCGSTAECGRAKAETTVRFRSPAPFLSLWCSPDNMPASHAGDHRSEAGQGRQFPARGSLGIADPPDSESGSLGRASRLAPTNFTCPQNILSDALLWYGSQLGATPGG